MIRLDKFLADSGVGTRTDVKKRIREGRITVNDAVAKKPDLKVDPEQDQILFDLLVGSLNRRCDGNDGSNTYNNPQHGQK